MQKNELIQLHTFLYQMKMHLQGMYEDDVDSSLNEYDRLEVTPYQIHKSKREHKLAVFTLSKEIADLFCCNGNENGFEKLSGRLEQMAIRSMTDKERELYHSALYRQDSKPKDEALEDDNSSKQESVLT